MNLKLVRVALKEARKNLEGYATKQGWHFRTYKLNCMCGISTYILFVFFKELGYRPTLCMNDNHCFLKLGNYWVDLTLTQFNIKCPSVWFKRRPYRKDDGYGNVHRITWKGKTIPKVRKMFRRWPKDQNPFKQKGMPMPKRRT